MIFEVCFPLRIFSTCTCRFTKGTVFEHVCYIILMHTWHVLSIGGWSSLLIRKEWVKVWWILVPEIAIILYLRRPRSEGTLFRWTIDGFKFIGRLYELPAVLSRQNGFIFNLYRCIIVEGYFFDGVVCIILLLARKSCVVDHFVSFYSRTKRYKFKGIHVRIFGFRYISLSSIMWVVQIIPTITVHLPFDLTSIYCVRLITYSRYI